MKILLQDASKGKHISSLFYSRKSKKASARRKEYFRKTGLKTG